MTPKLKAARRGVLLAILLATASATHPSSVVCAPGTATLLSGGVAQGSAVQRADCSLELSGLRW